MVDRRGSREAHAAWRFGLVALLAVGAGAVLAGARVSPALAVEGTP
jgi:hypothetical protein